MNFYEEAINKLDEGVKAKMGRYAEAMKKSVRDVLAEFCRQDGEFAQAVANGGSFKDCMEAVAKCVKGNSISDLEAWGAAVRFYFPGAGIRCEMRINLCEEVEDPSGTDVGGDGLPRPRGGLVMTEERAGRDEKTVPAAGPVIDLSDFF